MADATTNDPDGPTYLRACNMLALWAKHFPESCDPSDFGTGSTDLTTSETPRSRRAIASFQRWALASPHNLWGNAITRSDGALDRQTYDALDAENGRLQLEERNAAATKRTTTLLWLGGAAVVVLVGAGVAGALASQE